MNTSFSHANVVYATNINTKVNMSYTLRIQTAKQARLTKAEKMGTTTNVHGGITVGPEMQIGAMIILQ